ncbi:hypothetical protein KKG52_00550 [Patescibacteria group bacterium]|nr:hypothetical protein [Patescibacteria group bacterium]
MLIFNPLSISFFVNFVISKILKELEGEINKYTQKATSQVAELAKAKEVLVQRELEMVGIKKAISFSLLSVSSFEFSKAKFRLA